MIWLKHEFVFSGTIFGYIRPKEIISNLSTKLKTFVYRLVEKILLYSLLVLVQIYLKMIGVINNNRLGF